MQVAKVIYVRDNETRRDLDREQDMGRHLTKLDPNYLFFIYPKARAHPGYLSAFNKDILEDCRTLFKHSNSQRQGMVPVQKAIRPSAAHPDMFEFVHPENYYILRMPNGGERLDNIVRQLAGMAATRGRKVQDLLMHKLVRGVHHMAIGLQKLAHAHIVHGDLATRNVVVQVKQSLDGVTAPRIVDWGLAFERISGTEFWRDGRPAITDVASAKTMVENMILLASARLPILCEWYPLEFSVVCYVADEILDGHRGWAKKPANQIIDELMRAHLPATAERDQSGPFASPTFLDGQPMYLFHPAQVWRDRFRATVSEVVHLFKESPWHCMAWICDNALTRIDTDGLGVILHWMLRTVYTSNMAQIPGEYVRIVQQLCSPVQGVRPVGKDVAAAIAPVALARKRS
jgi:hypothetical protein